MSSTTVIPDDDDEFYATFDLDGAVAQARSQASSQSLVARSQLRTTLFDLFGYSEFRTKQADVIEAALSSKDTCVLWPTGSGKSICYQLPALHSKKTVLVVSPLISLMTDQVKHLTNKIGNMLDGRPLACLLGSANKDRGIEDAALRGDYLIVYLTPEKLCSDGFLDRLAPLVERKGILLLAVDEAHCVSAWGHDFRKEYRNIGIFRRKFAQVPIMALTATAVPRVRDDIITSLELASPFVSVSSSDRPNLRISVTRKKTLPSDLKPFLDRLIKGDQGSTIVYVPTIKDCVQVSDFMAEQLKEHRIECRFYHGSLSTEERTEVHYAFLSGAVRVVVATVAFGMGIDKPDIRRVIHYGAPKTMEEYYQHIGRAGRDGLPAECNLIFSDNDFVAYGSDFYTKGLSGEALASQQSSTDALRRFAAATEGCRRREILTFFGELPPFQQCGTCDLCLAQQHHKGDLTRDFHDEATLLLLSVDALTTPFKSPAMTAIKGLALQGKWPAPGPTPNESVTQRLKVLRDRIRPERRSEDFLKELLSSLTLLGYLKRSKVKVNSAPGQYSPSWEVYSLEKKGKDHLISGRELRLAVPQSLRKAEEEQEAKKQQKFEELQRAGIDLTQIPEAELASGDGEVLKCHLHWIRTLKRHRESGHPSRAEKLEELLALIHGWRAKKAMELGMAPAAVLSEHTAKLIAYTQASDVDALRQAGVRIKGVEELAELLTDFKSQLEVEDTPLRGKRPLSRQMVLPIGPWTSTKRWPLAVYKPGRGGTPAAWEPSHTRFAAGEHPQTIAMNQDSGKPVQVATVIGHILQGLLLGRPVDLRRLVDCAEPGTLPDEVEWSQMEDACITTDVDVMKVENVALKELLQVVVGPGAEVTPAWYAKARWWLNLKRASVPISFQDGSETPTPKRLCPPV